MKIPVFHDDQHGTAIIVAAAVQNALYLTGKKIEKVKIVTSGAGAAALACLNLLVVARREAREHLRLRSRRRGLQGPPQADGPLEGRLRAGHQSAKARRDHRRRRCVPRRLGRRRAAAGHGQAHGGAAADHGARQSESGNHAGGGHGGAARRHDLHRPFGLSEPGQQRPVLSLHLPRRARCRRHHHQRGDEARGRGSDRGAGARGAVRCRRPRLWRRGADLRPRLAHSQSVRSAADPAHRAGGRAGGDRIGRRRRGRSTISTPITSGSTASCSAPASS